MWLSFFGFLGFLPIGLYSVSHHGVSGARSKPIFVDVVFYFICVATLVTFCLVTCFTFSCCFV